MSEINQNVKDSRQQYYQHISGQNLTPLWESLHHLVPQTPNANCVRPTGIIRKFVRY